MIDFTTVKSLTIPEGSVAKITDASGNVLWNSVKMATITITVTSQKYADGYHYRGWGHATATIDGVVYGDSSVKEPTTYTLSVPVGTAIACKAEYYDAYSEEGGGEIYLNKVLVASSDDWTTYDYVVTGNATIALENELITYEYSYTRYGVGYVYITEG